MIVALDTDRQGKAGQGTVPTSVMANPSVSGGAHHTVNPNLPPGLNSLNASLKNFSGSPRCSTPKLQTTASNSPPASSTALCRNGSAWASPGSSITAGSSALSSSPLALAAAKASMLACASWSMELEKSTPAHIAPRSCTHTHARCTMR